MTETKKTLFQLFLEELETDLKEAAVHILNGSYQDLVFKTQALRVLWHIKSAIDELRP